jgi:DNA-binding NtrC family response regulator
MKLMIRPCYLVVDRETSNGISTRKLIIETAKFNVITAYSSQEALETLKKYPALDGVVTDSGMADMPCEALVTAIKAQNPKMIVIVVSTPRGGSCDHADHNLESFNPRLLLDLLQKLQPEAAATIERRNEDLEDGLAET